MSRSPLPHQKRAIATFWALYEQGKRKICVQAPCGAGKSMLSTMIIKDAIERLLGKSRNKKVHIAFLGHRRLLVSQTSRVFDEEQIEHGIQAAGMDRDEGLPIQICSRDTLTSRHLRRKHKAPIPLIDLLIIDERHVNKSGEIVELEKQMRDKNPDLCTLSLTATPVDIWNVCDDLIIAGTNSELRATVPPLHLPCKVFAPDMLDIRMLKRNKVSGEFEEAKSPWANAQYAPTIFGRVYPHWKALNPDQRPAILFAPSVASSMYFVDLFLAKGVPAAHIDGECIYTGEKNEDGSNKVNFTTDIEEREKVFSGLKSGQYKVLCNRLVLADAIDLPWAYHLILATSFGSIATYLQAVGRIQRAHPSLPGHVCLARGTKILTNKGLVEIQDVTRDHRVWDGVEFVEHDGAVCRGVKPVIEWDGLVATPDHKVHTEAGWEEISEAAHWQRRITVAGVSGTEISLSDHSDSQDSRFWSKASGGSSMRSMQRSVHGKLPQAGEKGAQRLQALSKHIWRSCARMALQESSEAATKMPRSNDCGLQRLWWTRHKVHVRFRLRSHVLDCCESRHSRRQVDVYRQDRQREELRARKLAMGHSNGATTESAREEAERKEWALDGTGKGVCCKTSRGGVRPEDASATLEKRTGRRGHHKEVGEVEVLQEKTAEVWDIINCGPRHRYCANCKLVSNCVQDHGSNALRFGHPDIDREWKVGDKWSDFVREIGEESDRIKDKSKPENEQKEILCECGQFRVGGPVCPSCGRQSGRGKVMVLQLDGKLKPFKPKPPKKVNTDPPAIKEWKSLVYRVKNAHSARGMTFEMALNAFKREHRGCIVHPNKDKNGVERWCVLHDGKVCPIPLLPPIADSHMMSLRVGQVSPDDFKKLYRLSNE